MANKRILTLGFLFALAWVGMIMRVGYIQLVQSSYYQALAYSQSVRRNVVAPKRGEILDRDLQKLVVNADVEMESGLPGNNSRLRKLSRVCPQGALAGQVLGTVGKDGYGQLGLEYFLDRELRGTDGWDYSRHDVKNRYYPGFGDKKKEAINGMNVVLTLDSKIQEIVEHALERGVQKAGAKQGVAIVIEPYTGDILSMANYPFYDPNTRDGADKEAWKNQAVVKVYEPGSTFKSITATALMEEKLIKPQDTVDGENGEYKLAGETIKDTHPHGRISFKDALAYSSNICFAKVATRMKAETFYKYIRSFGFGMKSGIGLPAEEGGVLKNIANWSGRTQSTIAFGHEISATPMQVAMAFSAIANGGLLMKPRIVRGWNNGEPNNLEENPTRIVRRVMSESTSVLVKSMLKAVIDYGTAADIKTDRMDLAGKTGTAEKIDAVTGHYVHGLFNSSFVGMAPVDHPDIVCLVLLDEPSLLKYGGQSAAPIFREIVDRLMANPENPLAKHAKAENSDLTTSKNTITKTISKTTSSSNEPPMAQASMPDLIGQMDQSHEPIQGQGSIASIEKSHVAGNSSIPSVTTSIASSANSITAGKKNIGAGIMPDLNNLTLRDALQKLKNLGLEVEYSGNGRIIHQEPNMGANIRPGQKCSLTLGWTG